MKDRRAERKNEAEDRRRLEQKYRPLRGIYLQIWANAAAVSTALTTLQEHPVGFLNTLKTRKNNMVTHSRNAYYVSG
jgi:hypothetical protein